jgi:hypothetical protein
MNQLPNGISGILIVVVLYVFLTIPLLAFFFIAIFSPGMRWMSFFTMLIAGVSAMFLLILIFGINLAELLPLRLIPASGGITRWLMILLLLAGYVTVFIYALTERDLRAIIYTWLVILLFNAGAMVFNAWCWLTWVKPVPHVYPGTAADLIMEHVRHPHRQQYLYRMIYPSFWVIISTFSLIKTVKEKIKLYLAATRQEQAMGPAAGR